VDMEVCVPINTGIKDFVNNYSVTVQSGDDMNNGPCAEECKADTCGACDTCDEATQAFFGERITSFRTLLKRYSAYRLDSIPNAATSAVNTVYFTRSNYPAYRGYSAYNLDTTSLSKHYNYVYPNFINYLMPAFLGVRGGMRWKTIVGGGADYVQNVRVQRNFESSPALLTATDLTTAMSTQAKAACWFAGTSSSGHNGMEVINTRLNNVIDYEVPYYSHLRWSVAQITDGSMANRDAPAYSGHRISTELRFPNTTTNSHITFESYVATGEDFQLFFFLGPPLMSVLSADPAA